MCVTCSNNDARHFVLQLIAFLFSLKINEPFLSERNIFMICDSNPFLAFCVLLKTIKIPYIQYSTFKWIFYLFYLDTVTSKIL